MNKFHCEAKNKHAGGQKPFQMLNSDVQHTILFPNGIRYVRMKAFIDTLAVKAKRVDLIITNNLSSLLCFPVTQLSV